NGILIRLDLLFPMVHFPTVHPSSSARGVRKLSRYCRKIEAADRSAAIMMNRIEGEVITRRLMAKTLVGLVSFLAAITVLAPAALATVGRIREFHIPTAFSEPAGIAAGPDGNLWFTEGGGNNVGRVSPSGAVTEFRISTTFREPAGIASGPDGNL